MKNKFIGIFRTTLLLLSVLLLTNSCTKEEYFDTTTWFLSDFTVEQRDWLREPDDQSFYSEFNFQELNNAAAVDGVVLAAVLIDGTYRPLPYTTYFINEAGQYSAETISYEYNTNFIRFNVASFDLYEELPSTFKPKTYTFNVRVAYPR